VGESGGGFGCSVKHGRTARGMNREKVGAGGGDGADRASDGVRDVVEFEVEEDGVAAMAELVDDGVAFGEVEFEANLEPGAGVFEPIGEGEGGCGTGVIESDDQAGIHKTMVPWVGHSVGRVITRKGNPVSSWSGV
jgi:hypothetical protein